MLQQYREQVGKQFKDIFRVTGQDMKMFFERANLKLPANQGESRVALNILKETKYVEGLAQFLDSSLETGIVGDNIDIARRRRAFGKHYLPMPKMESLWWVKLPRQYEDKNTQRLLIAATVYLVISMFSNSVLGQFETLTILFGVFFSSLIEAVSEYSKDSQWLGLRREMNNQEIVAIRGDGQKRAIKIKDLVVGDVIEVSAGNRVPADCILFEEMNIKVDESSLHDKRTIEQAGGSVTVTKSLSEV